MSVGGLILSPDEALKVGLVDEIVSVSEVVERSVAWCVTLLALPPEAMQATRLRARADLVSLFETGFDEEMQKVLDTWWSEETQSALARVVNRLGKST